MTQEFGNLHEREEAVWDLRLKFQGHNEKIGPFITSIQALQLKARFGVDRLWKMLMEGIKKKIREYIVRNHPKLMNEPSRSEVACFWTILSAGKAVEHESVQEVLY